MMTSNRRRLPFCLGLTGGLLLVVLAGTAVANTYTVTSLLDSGAGTLRDAISQAQPGDTILFDGNVAGYSILLDTPLLIEDDLTVRGPAGRITLAGGMATELLEVRGGATVTLEWLTFADGISTDDDTAGGVHVHGQDTTVEFLACHFFRNTADADRHTAGALRVADGATVTIRDGEFLNNVHTSPDDRSPCDILVVAATLHAERTWFHDDDHGLFPSAPASIFFHSASTVELIDCLHHPDVSNAVYTVDSDSSLYMENCTVYAQRFNGVITGAPAEFHACTLIGATDEDLLHNIEITIGGSAIGIHDQVTGGSVTSLGGNAVATTNAAWTQDDIVGANLGFGPLDDNGGPLPTLAPLPGSGADGTGFYAASPSHDARGYLRTDERDAGAYDGRSVGLEPAPSVLQAGVVHTVQGARLDAISEIRAGGEVADVISQNETTLSFFVARASSLGTTSLEFDVVTGSNVWSDSFEVTLTEPPPLVTAASPDPVEPEEVLTVEGDWLDQASMVTIGGVTAVIESAAFDQLEVTLDASTPGGPQVLAVTTPFGTDTSLAVYVDADNGNGNGDDGDDDDDNGGCAVLHGATPTDRTAAATLILLLLFALTRLRRMSAHGNPHPGIQ